MINFVVQVIDYIADPLMKRILLLTSVIIICCSRVHAIEMGTDVRVWGFIGNESHQENAGLLLPIGLGRADTDWSSTVERRWSDAVVGASALVRSEVGSVGVAASIWQSGGSIHNSKEPLHTLASADAGWMERLAITGSDSEVQLTTHLTLHGSLSGIPDAEMEPGFLWTHLAVIILDNSTSTELYRYEVNQNIAGEASAQVNVPIEARFTTSVGVKDFVILLSASTASSGLLGDDFSMGVDALNSLTLDMVDPFTVPEGFTLDRLTVPVSSVPDSGSTLPLMLLGFFALVACYGWRNHFSASCSYGQNSHATSRK